jgi:hypothetical protein
MRPISQVPNPRYAKTLSILATSQVTIELCFLIALFFLCPSTWRSSYSIQKESKLCACSSKEEYDIRLLDLSEVDQHLNRIQTGDTPQ